MVTVIWQNITTTIEKWIDCWLLTRSLTNTHTHSIRGIRERERDGEEREIVQPYHMHIEEEKHFAFTKSFIWKFFWLCFRHVSSSCQCQRYHLLFAAPPTHSTQMIWMCRFYTSRPHFPMYLEWESDQVVLMHMNGKTAAYIKYSFSTESTSKMNRYFLSFIEIWVVWKCKNLKGQQNIQMIVRISWNKEKNGINVIFNI